MNTSISETIEAIRHSLDFTSRHAAAYSAAHARHRALAPYETVLAALAAFEGVPSEDGGASGALLAAAIDEHRRAPACQLWQSLLTVAFAPMLLQMRARLGARKNADQDQSVLLAFLEALRSAELDLRTPRSLETASAEALRGALRGSRDRVDHEPFVEEDLLLGHVDAFERALIARDELRRLLRFDDLDRQGLETLLEGLADGESLKDYVDRAHPALGEPERLSLYRRAAKDRLRLVTELQTRLRAA